MGMPGPLEMLLIFGAILLIFGAKRIPEIARGLGQGIREFKNATNEITKELEREDQQQRISQPQAPQQGQPQPRQQPQQQSPQQQSPQQQAPPEPSQANNPADASNTQPSSEQAS